MAKKTGKGKRRYCSLNKKCQISKKYGWGNKRRLISGKTCSKGLQRRAMSCVKAAKRKRGKAKFIGPMPAPRKKARKAKFIGPMPAPRKKARKAKFIGPMPAPRKKSRPLLEAIMAAKRKRP
jgi:hypothetical protein